MRPLSLTANLFLRVWNSLPVVLWLICFIGLGFLLSSYTPLPVLAAIPASLVAGAVAAFALRPVRKAVDIALCKVLARSPIRPVMEVGVWQLLKVAHRYWPNEPVTDFIGLAALHQTYDRLDEKGRHTMFEIISQMQGTEPVGNGARDFLDQVLPA
jgi:hypothetical protein